MKKNMLIWAFVFLALWAFKHFSPQNVDNIRNVFIPALLNEEVLKDSIASAAKLLTGNKDTVYTWESGAEKLSDVPAIRADVSADFPLDAMIYKNLHSFIAPTESLRPSATLYASQGKPSEDFGNVDVLAKALTGGFLLPPTLESSVFTESSPQNATPYAPIPAEGGSAQLSEQAPDQAPEQAPEQSLARVDDFLQRQAVFAQQEIPANVISDFLTLPFEIAVPASSQISSVFGFRVHPIYGDVRFHYGTDFAANVGDEIYAFADGTVIASQQFDGYGSTVILSHEGGYSTLYAHCSSLLVSYGDTVQAGQLIALSGQSGNVTGPHLHFELIKDGCYLNPEYYL